jgi:histidinol-phosphate aminotransferase
MSEKFPFIKRSIRELEPYQVQGAVSKHSLVKLNQNENPFDVPEKIKQEIINRFADTYWNRYPEVLSHELHRALSEYTGFSEEGTLAGNGSNELMYTVLMSVVGEGVKVLLPVPSFFLYEKVVKILGGQVIPVLMNEDLSFPTERILAEEKINNPSLIIIVSPNSPTGKSMKTGDVESILRQTRAMVIVDEAYIEFSDKESVQTLLERYSHLVILRTFSKAFSMAGLRIGYLLAQPELCSELVKPKIPFTVNNFSAAVAISMLAHTEEVYARIRTIRKNRDYLFTELSKIESMEVFSSDANFIIFRTLHESRYIMDRLLQHNVLVRDVSSYPLLSRMLRVNAGTEEECEKFISALKHIL